MAAARLVAMAALEASPAAVELAVTGSAAAMVTAAAPAAARGDKAATAATGALAATQLADLAVTAATAATVGRLMAAARLVAMAGLEFWPPRVEFSSTLSA